ncbi:MAG: hypothetical protein ACE5SW_11600 [Nitrososphaeraceae archaeon]
MSLTSEPSKSFIKSLSLSSNNLKIYVSGSIFSAIITSSKLPETSVSKYPNESTSPLELISAQ